MWVYDLGQNKMWDYALVQEMETALLEHMIELVRAKGEGRVQFTSNDGFLVNITLTPSLTLWDMVTNKGESLESYSMLDMARMFLTVTTNHWIAMGWSPRSMEINHVL